MHFVILMQKNKPQNISKQVQKGHICSPSFTLGWRSYYKKMTKWEKAEPIVFGDLRRLRDLGAFGKTKQNQSKQNQITYRQPLPKVCIQKFHGQDEDQFWIFWALFVQFRLGIMHQEGFWELWILGFFGSKSLNLEVWKIWGMDVETAPYLRK